MFICLQGQQHHIRDGTAVDTTHNCEESDIKNVVKTFLHTKEGSSVRWTCRGCRHAYHHGTPKCNKTMCATIRGHTLAQVVDLTLAQVEAMLLSVKSWDPLALERPPRHCPGRCSPSCCCHHTTRTWEASPLQTGR